MLKVLIGDYLLVARKGIKQILWEEFTPILFGEVDDVGTLLEKTESQNWDILIIDSVIADNHPEIIKQLLQVKPQMKILVLYNNFEDRVNPEIIKHGSCFYLNKRTAARELQAIVRRILISQDLSTGT